MKTTPLPFSIRALAAVILLVGLAWTASPGIARAQAPAQAPADDRAWRQLPDAVTIGLPKAPISDEAFGAALEAALAVKRLGRRVGFEDSLFPHIAVIERGATQTTGPRTIVIEAGANTLRSIPLLNGSGERNDDNVTLAEMGIDPGEQSIEARGEWRIALSMRDMPADRQPAAIDLDIVAGNTGDEPAPVIHTYLNNVLIGSHRLRSVTGPQRIAFALPNYLIGMDNEARIVLQRCVSAECGDAYPARILPTSTIRTERMPRATTLTMQLRRSRP